MAPVTAPEAIGLRQALSELLGALSPKRRRQLVLVLALMLAGAVAELAIVGSVMPFLSLLGGDAGRFAWASDWLGRLGAQSHDQRVIAAALLFIVTVIIASAVRLQLAWSSQKFVLDVGHDLGVEIQRRLLLQPYAFHIQQNSSEVIASLEKVQLLTFVLQQLMQAATGLVIGLLVAGFLVSIDPLATILAFAALAALHVVVSLLSARRLAANSRALGGAYGARVQIVQESLGGIRDVIIDQAQGAYVDAFRTVNRRLVSAQASSGFIANAPRYVIEAAALVFIAGLAILIVGREGGLASGLPLLGALAIGGLRLLPLLQQVFRSWTALVGNRAVAGQVLALLRLPEPTNAADDTAPLAFARTITLDGVRFTYPGRDRPAADGISLTIARGSRVALVGPTGGGKSTLTDLIMGLLQPDEGRIEVDGVRLGPANLRGWQRNIAHVAQSVFLADASIARNIAFSRPGAPVDLDRVRQAARAAELETFVDSLPDGFDSQVGERGVRLSGGQRQRLGIARALYKDAPLLILDEATNALDRDTEAAVMGNLFADPGRTIIIVAHRESTIKGCDRVVRLADGLMVGD